MLNLLDPEDAMLGGGDLGDDNHLLVAAECARNILTSAVSSKRIVSMVVEHVAEIALPSVDVVGGNALEAAVSLAQGVSGPGARGAGKRRRALQPGQAVDMGPRLAIADQLAAFCAMQPRLSGKLGVIKQGMAHVQDLFELEPEAAETVFLSVACGVCSKVDTFLDKVLGASESLPLALSACLGISVERASAFCSESSKLAASGMVMFQSGASWFAEAVSVAALLKEILNRGYQDKEELRTALVGKCLKSDLTLENFPHLVSEAEVIQRIMMRAKADKLCGINILFHGAVGVGKTSLAAAIARDLALYPVGEATKDGKEPERDARLQALLIAQQILAPQDDAVALVDEADDVLVPYKRGKIWVNRLLEQNRVPVFYIVNDASDLDDAVKRRMTYVLELKSPPTSVREGVIRRVLDEHGVTLNDAEVGKVMELGNCAPAIISNAARAAALSGGGVDVLVTAARNMMQVIDGHPVAALAKPALFDPRFSSADMDLVALADRLAAVAATNFSLLMLGKPGTGKSAMARFIAERLKMPVLQVAANQVLAPFVGQSERNLARSFEQARADGSFLIIDEVDSFGFSRDRAVRSHEVSLTNALLEQLEKHPLPMACCTNALSANDRLDAALLRRFTFKVNFDFLPAEKARGLFKHMFGLEPPRALDRLASLAPGDFEVVRRKAAILGLDGSPEALADMLAAECAAKGEQAGSIGFHHPLGSC